MSTVEKKQENKAMLPVYDFSKEFKYLFSAKAGKPEIVEVPPFKYLKADGRGDPNTAPEFAEKIGLLYGLAYTLKFMLKKDETAPFDFKVAPMSGLWDADDKNAFVQTGRKEEWKWTIMILMPDRVTNGDFEKARAEFIRKKKPAGIDAIGFEVYDEGKCAQILHLGPYSEEGPTIETLHSFFDEQGYTFNGFHHEIYIGDPRKSKPEKLKTIIRQPIKPKEN